MARGRGGISLVEVVVALVILSVATAATSGMLLTAASRAREADLHERLLWAATMVADSLSTAERASPGVRALPDGSRLEWWGGENVVWREVRPRDRDSAWVLVPVVPRGNRTTLGERP